MQIHELNNFTGDVDDAFAALDDGSTTGKKAIGDIIGPLDARIDNIIAGGAAPSEAEIIDARLGANGLTYASLGDAIRGQYGELDGDINLIFDDVPIGRDMSQLTGVVPELGTNGSAGGGEISLSYNANFDSYYYVVPHSMDIYLNASDFVGQYVALCYGTNFTGTASHTSYLGLVCTNPTRLRTTDGNLPTADNKLHLSAGDVFSITTAVNFTVPVYGVETKKVVKETFADEVTQAAEKSAVYIQYISGAGVDDSTERVLIYEPTVNGYIRYRLVHTVKNSIKSNIWRIADAYAVDDDFNDKFALTTAGEWECALHLSGAPDFAGGYAHGDEILTGAAFFVDGNPVDITTYTTLTAVEKFSIVEYSNLYNPSNEAQVFAYHGSEHKFTKSGLIIDQSVLWLVGFATLDNCYLAMLPIAQAITDKYYTNRFYSPTAISGTSHTEPRASIACIYGDASGVACSFKVSKYDPKSAYFLVTDNGGSLYNKCYFAVDVTGGVSQSDLWESTTEYKFDIV